MNFHPQAVAHRIFGSIEKRIRFVISCALMTALMVVATVGFFDQALLFIPIFIIAAYFLTYFSILEDIKKIEWLTLFIMPILFTVSFYFFYFLFPIRWLTRLPFIIIFAFAFYAILLTSNIFNISSKKSLQLYRAAFSVNYLFQTIIIFLLTNVILNLRQNALVNAILVGSLTFILTLHLLWSVELKGRVEGIVLKYSFLTAYIVFQLTIFLSFLPISVSIFALLVTAFYYCISGLLYHHMEEKLFHQTLKEFLIVLVLVGIILLFSIQW